MLAWLAVGAGIVAVAAAARTGIALLSARNAPPEQSEVLLLAGGLAGVLIFGLGFRWLNPRVDTLFEGKEQLGSRETRLAWTLLIPTLAVFLLVAARPLEQTFIRSLTDKRFAGREVPSFVGLQNYQDLLGIRFDVVACRIDEETGNCQRSRAGDIRWDSIERELLQDGYRTVWNIRLPAGETPRSLAISGQDGDFLRSIWTTLLFAVSSVTLELVIALFMAMTVNSNFAGRGLMRAVMLIPWAIPTVISARLWELILKDTSAGIVNRVLMDMSLIQAPQAWLSDISLQIPAAVAVDVWKTTPFVALLLLAGLQSISKDLYEAASVDGASRVRQFFSITLPLLQPTIAVALVFRTLDALRVFDLFNVLFGRQQLSMATYNYETLVNNQQDGYASAISIILFLLISIFAVIYVRMLNVETD
ncbi:ABC transporter permease subunit [bacterium]|nr:ABC transporter permease subunit [bacterium]